MKSSSVKMKSSSLKMKSTSDQDCVSTLVKHETMGYFWYDLSITSSCVLGEKDGRSWKKLSNPYQVVFVLKPNQITAFLT